MQTTLQTLAPESESGEAGSAFELWPPSRTESNSSPSNVPVSNDPSPLQRPPSYRPPSLRQNEQPFVWAARATQPLSNSTHSRQQHTFADEMPYRSPTHMASLPISIPVPPPYREPTTTEPTSSTSHILSNATTSDIGLPNGIARARLPEVAGAAHSALGLDAAPPEYSPTPAPAEQPDIDSADSLPLAPPPPIVAAETFPISTPYETYSYGIRGSIPTGRGSRADATVIPIVAWRNGVQPPNTVLPAITICMQCTLFDSQLIKAYLFLSFFLSLSLSQQTEQSF